MRALGLMSGTSLDGIDVADVDVDRVGDRLRVRLRNFATVPFGAQLRATLVESLPPREATTACVAELNVAIGEAFASAALHCARAWGLDMADVDVIGSHGQTLYHAPDEGTTLQIGEPAIIAARTGVTCVADFRAADVAAGGQGAPLVAFFDREVFGHAQEYRAALNIGGIANLTLLPPGSPAESVRAFDTGPGNMVIDEVARLAGGGAPYDDGGAMAARGAVHAGMLDELLADRFFAQPPPKSTGRERFGAAYASRAWERARSLQMTVEDALATITALTARTVAAQVPLECTRVIASGGGVRNATLIGMLRAAIAPRVLDPSDVHGVPADAKEAMAFAVLGCEALGGRVNQLSACTGARGSVILGKIIPGANYKGLMERVFGTAPA